MEHERGDRPRRVLVDWSGEELHRGAFMTFTVNHGANAAWLRRSTIVVSTREALEDLAAIEARGKQLPGGTKAWRVLVDTRLAPGRNDGEFEQRILPRIIEVTNQYDAVGVLVASVVGKMQVQRVAREGTLIHHVFIDEAGALAFLSRAD